MAKSKSPDTLITIPARYARAALVPKGAKVKVINTHGTQVVDCWAFNAADTTEYMSMEHCRVSFERYRPKQGDTMVTNRRRRILTIIEDTAGGAQAHNIVGLIYRLPVVANKPLQPKSHVGRVSPK